MLRHGIYDFDKATPSGPPAPSYPTEGLVARWDFNDTLTDTESSITLTVSGTTTYATGLVGNAFSFNGSTALYTENSTVLSTVAGVNTYSLSYWIKGTVSGWLKYLFGGGNIEILDGIGDGGNLYVGKHSPGVALPSVQYTGNITDGTWHHVVHTYNGSQDQLYVDNTSIGTTADTVSVNMTRFMIGSDYAENSGFTGLMDCVYLYDDVLTTDEISTLYNSGSGV